MRQLLLNKNKILQYATVPLHYQDSGGAESGPELNAALNEPLRITPYSTFLNPRSLTLMGCDVIADLLVGKGTPANRKLSVASCAVCSRPVSVCDRATHRCVYVTMLLHTPTGAEQIRILETGGTRKQPGARRSVGDASFSPG